MDLIKKKKIKTLKELHSFNENRDEIQRQIRVLGLQEPFMENFQREIEELSREHEYRLKKIRRISKMVWITFGLSALLQVVLLILKLIK